MEVQTLVSIYRVFLISFEVRTTRPLFVIRSKTSTSEPSRFSSFPDCRLQHAIQIRKASVTRTDCHNLGALNGTAHCDLGNSVGIQDGIGLETVIRDRWLRQQRCRKDKQQFDIAELMQPNRLEIHSLDSYRCSPPPNGPSLERDNETARATKMVDPGTTLTLHSVLKGIFRV